MDGNTTRHGCAGRSTSDRGFTLVEILIVIVILGVLATVTVLAVRSTTSSARTNACENEHKSLVTAVEAYFVKEGAPPIAPTGTGDDRFEITMVNAEILRAISSNFDIAADGTLSVDTAGVCT